MGLDMYFHATVNYYESYSSWKQKNGEIDQTNYPEDIKSFGERILKDNFKSVLTTKYFQIGYFRKFNALHDYIVQHYADGVDDCKPINLSREDIAQMKTIMQRICNDPSQAEDLLPPAEGFFFGSTELDEWYFKDVRDALDLFTRILKDLPKDYEITYEASW